MILSLGGRRETPVPVEVADAVTLWFREHGQQARLVWCDAASCGEVQVKFLPGDPRLKGFQEGQYATDYESFWLHYHDAEKGHMVAYPLGELGAEGVRSLLDRANLWSGTGEYRSQQEAISAVGERNQRAQAAVKEAALQLAWDNAHERRARVLEIPRTTAIRPARLAHAQE